MRRGAMGGNAPRFIANGTPLTLADFQLSGGWGTTASVLEVSGNDQCFTVTIQANGLSLAVRPNVTLTFRDGPWPRQPGGIARMLGGTGVLNEITGVPGISNWVMVYEDLPIILNTYIIVGMVMGR